MRRCPRTAGAAFYSIVSFNFICLYPALPCFSEAVDVISTGCTAALVPKESELPCFPLIQDKTFIAGTVSDDPQLYPTSLSDVLQLYPTSLSDVLQLYPTSFNLICLYPTGVLQPRCQMIGSFNLYWFIRLYLSLSDCQM